MKFQVQRQPTKALQNIGCLENFLNNLRNTLMERPILESYPVESLQFYVAISGKLTFSGS